LVEGGLKWEPGDSGPEAHDMWREEPKLRDGRLVIHVGCNTCMESDDVDVTGLSESDAIARAEEWWDVHGQTPSKIYYAMRGSPLALSKRRGAADQRRG
jgi:hypothetical protein